MNKVIFILYPKRTRRSPIIRIRISVIDQKYWTHNEKTSYFRRSPFMGRWIKTKSGSLCISYWRGRWRHHRWGGGVRPLSLRVPHRGGGASGPWASGFTKGGASRASDCFRGPSTGWCSGPTEGCWIAGRFTGWHSCSDATGLGESPRGEPVVENTGRSLPQEHNNIVMHQVINALWLSHTFIKLCIMIVQYIAYIWGYD